MEHYYQPEIECAPYEEIRKIQSEKLVKQVKHVWDNVPYYRKKMEEKGVTPDDIKSVDDLHKLVASLASEGGIIKKQTKPKSGIHSVQIKEDPSRKPQRVLITWLADEPGIFSLVKKWIEPEDFADDLYKSIATKMWSGLSDGSFDPSRVLDHFTEEEEHREVAELFNTNLVQVETKEEREKAIRDILYEVKKSGFEKRLSQMAADDPEKWNFTLKGKRGLEELSKSKIVLEK